jgi:metal-responsive CopG/Arc/MetJ family transcriptional regulator
MNNKKRASYNITSTVLDEFEKVSSKSATNKSRLVEKLIVGWIKKQKESKEYNNE